MVALHERYHHRKPVTAKALPLGDDMLACVMGGVYTDVEWTMIGLQSTPIVQATRSVFQEAMQQRFIEVLDASPAAKPWRSSQTSMSARRRASCATPPQVALADPP